MRLAITREQHRRFRGPRQRYSSFPFLSRGGTITRRAIRRSERTGRRGNAVRTTQDLPDSHPGWNVERLFSKRTVLIALLALGWSGVALADQPKAQAPDPHALGMTEAVFDYCAKADPKGAAKVRARLKGLVNARGRERHTKGPQGEQNSKA